MEGEDADRCKEREERLFFFSGCFGRRETKQRPHSEGGRGGGGDERVRKTQAPHGRLADISDSPNNHTNHISSSAVAPANFSSRLPIASSLSVPPVCIRPSVAQDGASNEDDLTVKLTEIVFNNALIKQGLAKGAPTAQFMVRFAYTLLSFYSFSLLAL